MNPADLAAATKRAIEASKGRKQVPREQVVKDLVEFITKERWNDAEMQAIYQAARNKMHSKTCYECGKMQPSFGGELVWPDGDMSKPKRFRCADCKGVL